MPQAPNSISIREKQLQEARRELPLLQAAAADAKRHYEQTDDIPPDPKKIALEASQNAAAALKAGQDRIATLEKEIGTLRDSGQEPEKPVSEQRAKQDMEEIENNKRRGLGPFTDRELIARQDQTRKEDRASALGERGMTLQENHTAFLERMAEINAQIQAGTMKREDAKLEMQKAWQTFQMNHVAAARMEAAATNLMQDETTRRGQDVTREGNLTGNVNSVNSFVSAITPHVLKYLDIHASKEEVDNYILGLWDKVNGRNVAGIKERNAIPVNGGDSEIGKAAKDKVAKAAGIVTESAQDAEAKASGEKAPDVETAVKWGFQDTHKEWAAARIANGEDPEDFDAFRQHLIAVGGPDLGEQAPEEARPLFRAPSSTETPPAAPAQPATPPEDAQAVTQQFAPQPPAQPAAPATPPAPAAPDAAQSPVLQQMLGSVLPRAFQGQQAPGAQTPITINVGTPAQAPTSAPTTPQGPTTPSDPSQDPAFMGALNAKFVNDYKDVFDPEIMEQYAKGADASSPFFQHLQQQQEQQRQEEERRRQMAAQQTA